MMFPALHDRIDDTTATDPVHPVLGLLDRPGVDVHQHLLPPRLLEALASRTTPPSLLRSEACGDELLLEGEAPHDAAALFESPDARVARNAADGIDLAI